MCVIFSLQVRIPIALVAKYISKHAKLVISCPEIYFLKHSMWVTDDYIVKFAHVTSNYFE